jgi:hypothetical protein
MISRQSASAATSPWLEGDVEIVALADAQRHRLGVHVRSVELVVEDIE